MWEDPWAHLRKKALQTPKKQQPDAAKGGAGGLAVENGGSIAEILDQALEVRHAYTSR